MLFMCLIHIYNRNNVVNLPFIIPFIMDAFWGLLYYMALLMLSVGLMLLGFYSILCVLVPWKCYRDQNIWFISCHIMFILLTSIYMLLVDATLDGETSHVFYIFKLILTQLFKMFFYKDLSLQLLLDLRN